MKTSYLAAAASDVSGTRQAQWHFTGVLSRNVVIFPRLKFCVGPECCIGPSTVFTSSFRVVWNLIAQHVNTSFFANTAFEVLFFGRLSRNMLSPKAFPCKPSPKAARGFRMRMYPCRQFTAPDSTAACAPRTLPGSYRRIPRDRSPSGFRYKKG